jgi:small subunit ribosomal protein S20
MANHKSALKRIRSNNAKRLLNRYQAKSTRTFIKKLRTTTDKTEAQELLKTVSSMIDRLAKKNIIHKNKAANNKSKLAKHVNALAAA